MAKARGQTASEKQISFENFDRGRIYVAKVKDNRDPERNGTLRVWIKESQFDEENYENWIPVRYAPPFWGTTPHNRSDQDSFENTKKSYGMWFVPPDIENHVLVCFINNHTAFWFASVPEAYMNHMVPGIASGKTFASSTDLPVAEYNRTLTGEDRTRPAHDPLVRGLLNQGLAADYVRGQSTSSARREAPSRVQGILTPRGHQIVLDDGWREEELPDNFRSWLASEFKDPKKSFKKPSDNPVNKNSTDTGNRNDEMIRFRTRSGAQVMISETYGHIYFITRDGASWVELNNDGNIDFYGAGSFNVHAEQDLNFRADRDVNIEAGRNINFKAAGDHTDSGGDIKFESVGNFDTVIGGDYKISVTGKIHQSSSGEWVQQSSTGMHLNSGGVLNQSSSAATNIRAGARVIISGSQIHTNGPQAAPANSTDAASAPSVFSGVNIKQLSQPADPANGSRAQVVDRSIETISARIPTHEPWPGRGYENPQQMPKPTKERW